MASLVKVFGERNTGTRAVIRMLRGQPGVSLRVSARRRPEKDMALEAAIETHFKGGWRKLYLSALSHDQDPEITASDPWKHAAPQLTPALIHGHVRTLFTVRDPYSWALSMARRPYHMRGPRPDSFEAFLTRPWMSAARERVPPVLPSPMHLYCAKLEAYQRYFISAEAQGLACAILQFERFVPEPARALSAALEELGLGHLAVQEVPHTKPAGDLAALKRFHLAQEWRAFLTRHEVELISERVDWACAGQFGYRPLDPSEFPHHLTPRAQEARDAYLSQGRAGARMVA